MNQELTVLEYGVRLRSWVRMEKLWSDVLTHSVRLLMQQKQLGHIS